MPEVTRAQAGTYRQIGPRLRITRGPGKGETLSERPQNRGGRYLDQDEPTMVTFHIGDQVDVDFLIQVGAIEPKAETAKAQPKARSKTRRKSRAKPRPVEAVAPPDMVAAADPELQEVDSGQALGG
jgi:hypothetical protein